MSEPHRTASILAIGDELILGQKLDTNSRWIADRLTGRSVRVVEHATVDDDERQIAGALARLVLGADLIVCTGGLGPTADDLTRRGLALAMGEELVEDADAVGEIESWFRGRGRDMPETNRGQAMRPESARRLTNLNGTAPGLAGTIRDGERRCEVYCLPGPPGEMRPMYEAEVEASLRPEAGRVVRTRMMHTFGLGESEVARRLGELMERGRTPLVGTTASGGVVTCRLRFDAGASEDEAEAALGQTERLVREHLGEAVFATGGEADGALERCVVGLLRSRSERLVVSESCTGGLLGEMVTRVPGASGVFVGGWLTYTDAMKTAQLGVQAELVREHGAVSGPVALAMARGALLGAEAAGGSEHALAITGIAGPGGGTKDKPVGTVWIALASSGETDDVRMFRFGGGREAVRAWSARTALGLLRLRLAGVCTPLLGQVDPPQGD